MTTADEDERALWPTCESIEGFVLIWRKNNNLKDVCVKGGGGGWEGRSPFS